MHAQQNIIIQCSYSSQGKTRPQLLLSSRKTAASAYSTALTAPPPPEAETYPEILRKIETKYHPKNQSVNPGKTKHFMPQSPFFE